MQQQRALDERYMTLALEEASRASAGGEVPVGAVLVDAAGEVLARGRNRSLELCDPTAHAEIVALREAAQRLGNYRLAGTTLYVTVEPCCMCAGALVWARVERLVFGAADPKAGAAGSLFDIVDDRRHNHRLEVLGGIREKECRELLQGFFRRRRGEPGKM